MLEKPDIEDELILERLAANYALKFDAIEFLPVGNDQRAWSYRVRAENGACFLKLRRGGTSRAALIAPTELLRAGIEQPVAPLATSAGELQVAGEDFDLILYPFIEGESAWGMSLTAAQARQWGEIMRRIHDAPLSLALTDAVPREVFGLKWLPAVDRVEAIVARSDYRGAVAEAMARCWREMAAEIKRCRERYQTLGARLTAQPPEFVLCHADIHSANIIVDRADRIRIVDWDETVIAPKERDLMFFVLDGHSRAFQHAFFLGYGDIEINALALAYYKYDWVIQEFADYGERVFLKTDLGAKDLAASLRGFERLFEPDDVIDRARQADAILQQCADAASGIA